MKNTTVLAISSRRDQLRPVFHLEKWYGDVVTAQGAGAVVYAARLRWGALRVGYGAALILTDGHAPTGDATVRGVAMPRLETPLATWRNAALRADARWCRDAAPIKCRLMDGPDGAIQWTCHMPRAVARVKIGSSTVTGLGYLEQLQLSIPPWKLPFRELHWGRYLSPRHCAVWIDWAGDDSRRWSWLDGVEQAGWRIVFDQSRTIRDQPVVNTIGLPLPDLARRLAGQFGRARERKRLSRAVLMNEAGPLDEGWAIHEEVMW